VPVVRLTVSGVADPAAYAVLHRLKVHLKHDGAARWKVGHAPVRRSGDTPACVRSSARSRRWSCPGKLGEDQLVRLPPGLMTAICADPASVAVSSESDVPEGDYDCGGSAAGTGHWCHGHELQHDLREVRDLVRTTALTG
jgi:hypothetical protein